MNVSNDKPYQGKNYKKLYGCHADHIEQRLVLNKYYFVATIAGIKAKLSNRHAVFKEHFENVKLYDKNGQLI